VLWGTRFHSGEKTSTQWCTEGGYAALNISKFRGRDRPIFFNITEICWIWHF
jgi:hypothetical protein